LNQNPPHPHHVASCWLKNFRLVVRDPGRPGLRAGAQAIDDEVAVYDRPLTPAEIIEHFRAAGEQFVHRDHW